MLWAAVRLLARKYPGRLIQQDLYSDVNNQTIENMVKEITCDFLRLLAAIDIMPAWG